MNSRYDQLERLQRLRESGAPTDGEHYVRGPGGYAVAGGKSTMETC